MTNDDNKKHIQKSQTKSDVRPRLGKKAMRLIKMSKATGLSPSAKLEFEIDRLQEESARLYRNQALLTSFQDNAEVLEELASMREQVAKNQAENALHQKQTYDCLTDLNEQIYLLRIMVVAGISNYSSERLEAVKEIERKIADHQKDVVNRTPLNNKRFEETTSSMEARRGRMEDALIASHYAK